MLEYWDVSLMDKTKYRALTKPGAIWTRENKMYKIKSMRVSLNWCRLNTLSQVGM